MRFADSNETQELYYEIEKWDTNGTSYVWVQVPAISSSGDYIYAYWGKNTNAPAYTTNGSTWNSSFKGVWHLKEESGVFYDSTTNANNSSDAVTSTGKFGRVNGGQEFNGAGDYLAWTKFVLSGGLTFSAWVKTTNTDSTAAYGGDAALNVLGDNTGGVYLGFGVQGGKVRYAHYGTGWEYVDSVTSVNDGNWHQIAVAHSNGVSARVAVYVDGKLDNSGVISYNSTYAGVNRIGTGYGIDYFQGNMDEVQVSLGVRGSNWIWAAWLNQASNTTFLVYGNPGTPDMRNATATNVTLSSAYLNGYLAAGSDPVTVSLFWGDTDGGNPALGLWKETNTWAEGTWTAGSYPTYQATSLTSNKVYFYRYYATNSIGHNFPSVSESVLIGEVAVAAAAQASEVGPTPGAFTISRNAAATNGPITVNFTLSGTAGYGTDYTASPTGSVVLAAGQASATVVVTPNYDATSDPGETVILTIDPGAYIIGAPSSDTLTIADAGTIENRTVATGSPTSDWFSAASWTLGHVPTAGEGVMITNSLFLSNSTAVLGLCVISNASLVFTNWSTALIASNVVVQSGGRLTLPNTFVNGAMSNRINVVCTNFGVEVGGSVDADSKGYANTNGPGGPASSTSGYTGGGGHGGKGGDGLYSAGGAAYDSITAPSAPGSGGGNYQPTAGNRGGPGGGVIRISASANVTVNGTLSANGGDAEYAAGGGAGGSIWITCGMFGGSTAGMVRASGGSGYLYSPLSCGGGGAGGRIAVNYGSAAAVHGVRFRTSPGSISWRFNDWDDGYVSAAQPGTLSLPDTALLSSSLTGDQFRDVRLYLGVGSWNVDSLTVNNCSLIFAQDGFQLTVTNGLRIEQGGKLGIGAQNGASNATLLAVGQDLLVTNGGTLYVYAGVTNSSATYGATVSVTGVIRVAASSWIYPFANSTNGGAVLFRAADVSVAANGGINASAKGFLYEQGPGKGLSSTAGYPGGGGHGGRGGDGWQYQGGGAYGGGAYGSASAPLTAGSGAGNYTYAANQVPYVGGLGGGVVRVVAANTVTVDGTISANGGYPGAGATSSWDTAAAGGAGGSVFITCGSFAGNGQITAQGADGDPYNVQPTWYSGGGGGGGRIAVQYTTVASPLGVRFTTLPGPSGYYTLPGHRRAAWMGTLWFPDTNILSTLITTLNGYVTISNVTAWSPASLTVSNASVGFNDNFVLNAGSDISIVGTNGALVMGTNSQLTCGGNLTLTNNGHMRMYGGPTNGSAGAYGAQVTVAGTIAVASNSWIYPFTDEYNGGAPIFRMNRLWIGNGGGFSANGTGYKEEQGPGRGIYALNTYGGGGGHGGKGGDGMNNPGKGGGTYGSSNAPITAGSGGASFNGTITYRAGGGGGAVRLDIATDATVNGTIIANGDQAIYAGGGGAGGSIFLACQSFSGGSSAALKAEGGTSIPYNPAPVNQGGGGGGGRIAVAIGLSDADRSNLLWGATVNGLYAFRPPYVGFAGFVSATNALDTLTSRPQAPRWEPRYSSFRTPA